MESLLPVLTADEETALLRIARTAIEAALGEGLRRRPGDIAGNQGEVPTGLLPAGVDPSARDLGVALEARNAAFVTLTIGGDLRGCIGRMDYGRPVYENVRDAAVASALDDPRFPALAPWELASVRLEISILEEPREIASVDAYDPGLHGIIVERDGRRALLLPSVAREHGWNATQVLEAACRKAGLPTDAWRTPGTRLLVFQARSFADPD